MSLIAIPSKNEFVDSAKDIALLATGVGATTAASIITMFILQTGDTKSNIYKMLSVGSVLGGIVIHANSRESKFIEGVALGLVAFGMMASADAFELHAQFRQSIR